jgi:hypothetical protein
MGRRTAAVCVVLLVGAAAAIIALETWHGPVVLSISSGHGVDTGDLLAFPFAVLAIAIWRGQAHGASAGRFAGPAAAVVLGVLLLLAGVVAKAGGGSLMPAGGGTFDGTIQEASSGTAVPVDRWSDVAVTYDGDTVRLYINAHQVASRAASGAIQISRNPLWIGGNQPYGEHFTGLIDEVRVYDRALAPAEIRRDMANRVAPARGLVAGYSFDAGRGRSAADSSGQGNAGVIEGATWAHGRYGDGLRFDGEGAVVRILPSASLDLTRTMTLSGWIEPTVRQSGWRTVVQRQADAYLLTAGSGRQNRFGRFDDLRAALVAAALAWFCLLIAARRGGWTGDRRRRAWWQPVALFVVGSLADALLAPTGALVGPILVAAWLAATASRRAEAVAFLLAAGAFALLTAHSLAVGSGGVLSRDEGAVARTAALGVLFLLAGGAQLGYAWRGSSTRSTQPSRQNA